MICRAFRLVTFVVAGALGISMCTSRAIAQNQPSLPASVLSPIPRPTVVRGLYVNRWAVLDGRIWQLIGVARTTEVNALVLDVKDDRGYVLYRSGVPLAQQIGADTINPVPADRIR